jgi:hypothetical protein
MAIRWENIILVGALAAGGYLVYKNWDKLFGNMTSGGETSASTGGGEASAGTGGGGTAEMARQTKRDSTVQPAPPSLGGYSDIKQRVADFLNEKYGDLMAELKIDQLDILHSYSFLRAFQEYALDQLGIGRDKWEQIYSQTSSGRPLGIENYMPISADPRATYLAYYVTLKAPELKPYFDAHYAPNLEEIRRQAEKVAQWYWETMPSYRERFGGNYEAYKNQLVEHYTNVAKQFGSTSPELQIVPPGGVTVAYDRILKRDVCLGEKCPGQGHTKLIEVRNGIPVYEYDPKAAERIRQQKSSQPVQASSVSMPNAPIGISTQRDLTSLTTPPPPPPGMRLEPWNPPSGVSPQDVRYTTYPGYRLVYGNTVSQAQRPSAPPPSTTTQTRTSYDKATSSASFLGTGAQRPQPGFMQSGTRQGSQSISSGSTNVGSAGTGSSFLNTFNQWMKGNASDADMIKALDAYIKYGK